MSKSLKQALLSPTGPSDIFAVAYLQLCQISYAADPASIPNAVATQVTPFSPGGKWHCGWGPVTSDDDANLVYVAVYYDGPNLPPTLAAVVTRGTDVDISDIWGILQQAFEDFYVPFQSPPPWLPSDSPVLVADGTLYALETIQGFASGNQTLLAYLTNFLGAPQNSNPVLVVTGHSLGGCVTTVVAPWLKVSLGQAGVKAPVVPATFAAPTAGNQAFANYYTSTFSYCPRYYNTLDIAADAWSNLYGVSILYDQCGTPVPDAVYIALLGMDGAMATTGASYAQQNANNAPLGGTCFAIHPADWYTQAHLQHGTGTYMRLLGGTSVELEPTVSAAPRRTRRRVVHHRLLSSVRSAENLLSRPGQTEY